MQRLSITLDDDLAAFARQEVEAGRAPSVSAFISGAVRQRAEDRLALLDELDHEAEAQPADAAVVEQLARALDRPSAWVRDALGLDG